MITMSVRSSADYRKEQIKDRQTSRWIGRDLWIPRWRETAIPRNTWTDKI